MPRVIVGTTMSLDGFINDRNGSVEVLYPDMEALHKTTILQKEIRNTGAVIMGRNAFAMADDPDWFAGNYEFQVPIFVLTHHPPARQPKETDRLKFHFVTDGAASAIRQAKAAAGEKDVTIIGGASTAQQALQTGLVDVVNIAIMPVLLGAGLKFFDNSGAAPVRLERTKLEDLGICGTYLEYRVVR